MDPVYVSSSCGSTKSESEARTKRIKESFLKDYETLHKFIDMMRNAEGMSVEVYNNDIIEKHNESVGFLKTAIFQAQSNVMVEAAKQRQSKTKAEFTYMKNSGLPSPPKQQEERRSGRDLGSGGNGSKSDQGSSQDDDDDDDDDDGNGMAKISADKSDNNNDANVRNDDQNVPSANKILNSLRKVACKSMIVSKSVAPSTPTPSSLSKPCGSPTLPNPVTPPKMSMPPSKLATSSKPFTPSRPPALSPALTPISVVEDRSEPQRNRKSAGICASTNVFESLRRSADPKTKQRAEGSVDPRRQPQLQMTKLRPGNAAFSADPRRQLQQQQPSTAKRPAEKKIGYQFTPYYPHSVNPGSPAPKKGKGADGHDARITGATKVAKSSLSPVTSGPPAPKKSKGSDGIHAKSTGGTATAVSSSYKIGTVVMAKYLKYSHWPAIIIKRPGHSEDAAESDDCVYVIFWEGKEGKMKTSCADVPSASVEVWQDRETAEELVPKSRRRRDFGDSIDLAEEMVLLTKEEMFWKLILIEEKFDVEMDYRPEREPSSTQGGDRHFPQKGDVVVVGKSTFYPGIITREELFADNLNRDVYFVSGHIHVSFMEENTHGWYPVEDVWILGKSSGKPWPVPSGVAGAKFRKSMEVAREVLKMPRDQRFSQIGAHVSS